ncbi:dephospho-CoA kinase [Ruania alba]|uniref:Dephospho-CoA kinase n=1 Tax=Ruania alba TaxID=648782 RepID=A0A1H5GHY5_9MICO|nr:dephospho-CoA kinase [Ruania alba]SEE15307.1 dephospho-CoA kinase [Ruania alba]
MTHALSIGLTGGIGAGKSSVARLLEARGAVVVDSDVLAREVIAPGTDGLAEVVAEFGAQVLGPDGALDRPALAELVFGDPKARARLNAIVHPRVREAAETRVATIAAGSVVVHDIPLLVENDLARDHHLVIVVGASERVRLERLARDRDMDTSAASARMAAQADDDARRRVADVWIDNEGTPEQTVAQVQCVWSERIAPYAQNVRDGRRADRPSAPAVVADPGAPRDWSAQAEDLLERLRLAGGPAIRSAHHIGSTSVPGLVAKDVLDLQLGVADLDAADHLSEALHLAGFPRLPGHWWDSAKDGVPAEVWPKRFHANADPGRPVNLHVRVRDGPGWQFALLFRDWLRADTGARAEYARLKRELVDRCETTGDYAEAKEPWFDHAWPRMRAWAAETGWVPPPS